MRSVRHPSRPAASFARDPRVDAYIATLPAWQQAVCGEVRDLVHAADREVVETIKRTKLPYFVLHGNICALLAAKDHVNVFIYDGGIVPDPDRIVTGGHGNKTARTIAIHEGQAVKARALTAIIKRIIAHNRAGGWRRALPSSVTARFRRLVDAFSTKPGVTVEPGWGEGNLVMKANGKIFALLGKERFVVKLPKARVDEIVGGGAGERFDPRSDGRLMKEWLVAGPTLRSIELAKEAHAFVHGSRKPSAGARAR